MKITFILVNPSVPENIGASARAMNTMGFNNLRLVNPCDHLCDKAKMLAHGSRSILEKAVVFSSLEKAIQDIDFVIGTTSKKRSAKEDYYPANQIMKQLQKKGYTISSMAILFGREESGLTNEEIKLCDLASSIPLHKPYPSLNLAQTVMIYAYLLSDFSQKTSDAGGIKIIPPSYPPLKEKIQKVLKTTKIRENKTLYNRIMERVALLEEDDIHLLHSITEEILKLVKENQSDIQ